MNSPEFYTGAQWKREIMNNKEIITSQPICLIRGAEIELNPVFSVTDDRQ